ncbi:MAG: hypothetical protein NVV60_12800 [Luteimonas sp.]|nr:hypothetical protein [Luteimonas sp.]
MDVFLSTSLSFPTLVYSVLLAVCLVYWLLAATGLVDIDLDGLGIDVDMDSGGVAGIFGRLGLTGLPTMIVVTLLSFFGWILTYFVHLLVLSHLFGPLRWLLGAGVGLLALVPAILATAAVLRPVRRALIRMRPFPETSLLGRVVIVRTPDVNTTAGMGELDDGGAGLILQIRSDGTAVPVRGDRVVLIAHDTHDNTWRVVPERDYHGA